MNETPKLYIAGIGMITPVGANTDMTAAAVRAGVSGYRASRHFTRHTRQPITVASVPDEVFSMPFEVDEGTAYDAQTDRAIKMAILALREAIAGHSIKKKIPLILATPEPVPNVTFVDLQVFIKNLLSQKELPLHEGLVRYLHSGRPGGIEGLALAHHYLYQQKAEYVLIGGSDSHDNAARIGALDTQGRLRALDAMDGFAPGEGAAFLLLTSDPARALSLGGYVVGLGEPGLGEEPGHFFSNQPYLGEGLDQAFKQALNDYDGPGIDMIYASMNGEHYWTKEYGVAYVRNQERFRDLIKVEHPADCFGDLGAATAPTLIGLAAERLLKRPDVASHLVYSSADGAMRAAVRLDKLHRL